MDGQSQSTNISDDLKSDICDKKVDYSKPYDESVTYRDIIEKDIIELMGFSADYPEEKRNEMREKINGAVEARVAEQILDRLPETERDEYTALIDGKKSDEAYQFLTSREIYPEEIFITEVLIMKLELYEDSKVVRGQAKQVLAEEDQKGQQNG